MTAHPLIIKALRAAGKGKKTDIVIRNVDAQTLHVVPEHFEFFGKGQGVGDLRSKIGGQR